MVTPRQSRGQWEKPLHQRVAGRLIVTPAIAREQSPLVERARQSVVAGAVAAAVVRGAPSRPNVVLGTPGTRAPGHGALTSIDGDSVWLS